jgi:hypothetical protein
MFNTAISDKAGLGLDTLESTLNIGDHEKEHGLYYVAFSRATILLPQGIPFERLQKIKTLKKNIERILKKKVTCTQ